MRTIRSVGFAVLGTLAAVRLHAQSSVASAAARQVTVTGTVYDSLTRSPLAGAEVQIVPADGGGPGLARTLVARTDADGRFRVDSAPAGRYRVGFFHPRVDSLGIGVAPVTLDLHDDRARLELTCPSAAGVQRQLCSPSEISDTTALLVGFVRDAATRQPRRGASVHLRWAELVLGGSGVRQDQPEIVVQTRGDGWYGVCGVPTTGAGDIGIAAESGADTSGVVPLRLSGPGVVRRDLYVGPRAADGRVRGVVRRAGGRPVAGARVRIVGGTASTMTDESGGFLLTGQPTGSQLLDVRALGYVPAQLAVDVLAAAPGDVPVTLTSVRTYLDTVKVLSRRAFAVDRGGFEKRRRSSPTGYFLTRDQIALRNAFRTSDLLAAVAGMRLDYTQFGQARLRMRSVGSVTCRPQIYVDGMILMQGSATDAELEDVDLFTRPERLDGVEVYRDPSFIPAGFHQGGGECGSVLLWTRPADPKPRKDAAR